MIISTILIILMILMFVLSVFALVILFGSLEAMGNVEGAGLAFLIALGILVICGPLGFVLLDVHLGRLEVDDKRYNQVNIWRKDFPHLDYEEYIEDNKITQSEYNEIERMVKVRGSDKPKIEPIQKPEDKKDGKEWQNGW